jgi:glutathione S-transferase
VDAHELLPTDPASRARVEMWTDWQASDFNNSWRVAFQGLLRNPLAPICDAD